MYSKCADVKPDSDGANLILKVVEKIVTTNYSYFDGSETCVSLFTVGDETASVTLLTREKHCTGVYPGCTYEMRNVKVEMCKGYMLLALDRWSSVEKNECLFEVNTSYNLSNVEYEVVEKPSM
eukprot:TRINITY_DN14033_c0_g1_i1.p1 TRINITY_DN14033_c0_g1~~TRINITY_DN14033_c0_g1_i1.p1  ORF type:complete len:138 (+),score=26.50 TRINITY_DN14033_c0_g1_i1:47-415(+)